MATLSLSSRLVTNPAGQPRPGQGCRCIVHAVVGGEGGDQRLPARPDRRPCRSLRESAGSGGPPTPSSSLRYCGQDAASRRRLCHMPTTLRYIFLRNLPCSTAPAPHLASCGSFSLPSAVPKPPRLLLLLEVKLVHTVDSKSWFKQGRKWEICSMNLGLGSKRKRGKVVDTSYPTGLLVEKTK